MLSSFMYFICGPTEAAGPTESNISPGHTENVFLDLLYNTLCLALHNIAQFKLYCQVSKRFDDRQTDWPA